jgi:hypothetical protein
MGRRPAPAIGGWIHEELKSWPRRIAPERLRDDRAQVASGAIAADRDRARIDAEVRGAREDPARRGDGVVGGGRKGGLGGEPVVDRDDDDARATRQGTAHGVVRRDRSEDEAAAVEPDEARRGPARPSRRVDPSRTLTGVARHARVACVDVVPIGHGEDARAAVRVGADLGERPSFDQRRVRLAHEPQDGLHLKVELEPFRRACGRSDDATKDPRRQSQERASGGALDRGRRTSHAASKSAASARASTMLSSMEQ